MYKGAIIGLGNVALNGHLPAWMRMPERFRIIAGVDPEPDRRKLFAQAAPEAACADSLSELPPDLDFVDICTPPYTHFELIVRALEHGWNVLCEKPLVLATWQLARIRRLANQAARAVFTVHNWKFAPICRTISELVQSGALGRVLHCEWQVLRKGPSVTTNAQNWRLDPHKAGGGILVDHGWHAFYLIHEWVGLRPRAVRASLESREYTDLEVEDTALVRIKFTGAGADEPTADIFLTWASLERRTQGTIQGSLAQLKIEDDVLRLLRSDGREERFPFEAALSSGSHHSDWFALVAQEFAGELDDASRRGANLRIAELCLRLVEQSRASHHTQEYLPI